MTRIMKRVQTMNVIQVDKLRDKDEFPSDYLNRLPKCYDE